MTDWDARYRAIEDEYQKELQEVQDKYERRVEEINAKLKGDLLRIEKDFRRNVAVVFLISFLVGLALYGLPKVFGQ